MLAKGLSKFLCKLSLSRSTKIKIYENIKVSVLGYESETWTRAKVDQALLFIFERKILTKIYGAGQKNNTWRRRYSFKIHKMVIKQT